MVIFVSIEALEFNTEESRTGGARGPNPVIPLAHLDPAIPEAVPSGPCWLRSYQCPFSRVPFLELHSTTL